MRREGGEDVSLAELVRSVEALNASGALNIGITSAVFEPFRERRLEGRRWPYTVTLDFPDDVATLRLALQNARNLETESHGTDLLDWWANAVAERHQPSAEPLLERSLGAAAATAVPLLFAQGPSAVTGVEQVLIANAANVQEAFADEFSCTALLALPGVVSSELAAKGVTVNVANRDFALPTIDNYRYSRDFLGRVEPALVHAHAHVGVPFCCALVDSGVPLVHHVHVADEGALHQLKEQLGIASKVLAVSDFVKRRVLRLGIPAERVEVVYNGIDSRAGKVVDQKEKARLRRSANLPTDGPIILMVARYAVNKRHDVAINALEVLRARMRDATLLCVGECFPGDEAVYGRLLNELGTKNLEKHVVRIGYSAQMRKVYAMADALILPSENDPAPLVLMEAMAHSVPIVAANSGGSGEIVSDGLTGLLVEPGDSEGFAASLELLLNEPTFRSEVVQGGLSEVAGRFGAKRFITQVVECYRSLR